MITSLRVPSYDLLWLTHSHRLTVFDWLHTVLFADPMVMDQSH